MTIAGANTAEGVQTVRAASTYTPTAGLGPGRAARDDLDADRRRTDPLHAGRARRAAAAGATLPYGSVFLSLGTERAPATLDCAPAAIAIADAAIPWSDAGRTGSAGRYAIEPNPATPVFASAVDSEPPPAEDPTPQPTASPAPPRRPRRDADARPVAKAPAGRIVSTRLTASRGGRIELRLVLPAGLLDLPRHDRRRAARRRSSSASASKIVTLTRSARYTIAPGKQRTVTLRLSKDGRAALKRKRSITRAGRSSRPARASPPRAGSR